MDLDWSQYLGGNTFTAEQIEQARAGETFATLESELNKLVSLQGESVDWALVQAGAQNYLEKEGSDLLVATWLVLAAFIQHSEVGLQQSLAVLVRLHQECWETMTPPLRRIRARRNQMQWFIEQLVRQVEMSQLELAPAHYEAVVSLWRELTQCWFKYDEEPPAFTSLLNVLVCADSESTETTEIRDETSTPNLKESSVSEFEERTEEHLVKQAPQALSSKVEAPVVIEPMELTQTNVHNGAQLEQQIDETFSHVLRGLGELSSDLLLEPLLYRFTRTAAWVSLSQLPFSIEGVTRLPAPSNQERERLELLQDQDVLAVLAYVESRVVGHRYWLDLHYAAFKAASKLEQGARIADTIAQESAHFVHRLAGVENLLFQDETPFASTATQQWLQQLLSPRCIEASQSMSLTKPVLATDVQSLDMSVVAVLAGAQAQAQVAAQNLLALEQQLGQNLERFLNK